MDGVDVRLSQAVRIGHSIYRFGADGYMCTGWVSEAGSWFYHDASGAQASGWVKDGSSWYFMRSSGAGLCSTAR